MRLEGWSVAQCKAMIDRSDALPLIAQTRQFGISRGSICYLPRPVSDSDLAIMRRIDKLHPPYPFAGSQMLRDRLRQEGMLVGRLHVATLKKRMRLEALYRRPDTSKPGRGARSILTCCASWPSRGRTKSGLPAPRTCPCHATSSTSSPSSTGSHGACWRGGCPSLEAGFCIEALEERWRVTVSR